MPNSSIKHRHQGVEILIRGTVQGVGFRPFIYNLASRLGISGTVSNTGAGVVIHAFARAERLDAFIAAISDEAPPLARIVELKTGTVESQDLPQDFIILQSDASSPATTAIPPDIALCSDCRRELEDRTDRRYRYPFTNCTNCGPRLSIVRTIPYDRPGTSMAVFPMCESCLTEYSDPANRRFHAQPNACPQCGPGLTFVSCQGNEEKRHNAEAVEATLDLLLAGGVMAIRGLGGFHLVTDAHSTAAIRLLRQRKKRPDKPLAIMVADLATAEALCHIEAQHERLLTSPQHPIVLLRKRENAELPEILAPGINEIGVMLPYTPLHHLLFHNPKSVSALVMTSGNISGNPICTDNEEAHKLLTPLVDGFLFHNRDIVTRVDDSVARVVSGQPLILRRSRGYVPSPIQLPYQLPSILGCGAGLKSTFCLGRGDAAYLSQHIGDLDNLETYDFFCESVAHFKQVFQFEPEAVACDLHPDYLSSRFAAELGLPLYQVQHHHAHAAAVVAEHGLEGPCLAVIMDGTGLGDDNTSWGGEFLQLQGDSYQRLAHLSHLTLPGGDAAATEPWRMALSAMYATFGPDGLIRTNLPNTLAQLPETERQTIATMLSQGFNCPPTSSAGRLFDAAASFLGLRQKINFEGQAAMELEAAARKVATSSWKDEILPTSHRLFSQIIRETGGKWEISSPEFVKMLVRETGAGMSPGVIALKFHTMLIGSITALVQILSQKTDIRQVVLSGGCMQNSLLLEGLLHRLKKINLQVYTGNALPVNDGAISLGQTVIGGIRHVSSNSNESDQRQG